MVTRTSATLGGPSCWAASATWRCWGYGLATSQLEWRGNWRNEEGKWDAVFMLVTSRPPTRQHKLWRHRQQCNMHGQLISRQTNERHIDTFYYVTDSRLLFPRQQISSECVNLARIFVAIWGCLFLRTAGTCEDWFRLPRRRFKKWTGYENRFRIFQSNVKIR